MAIEVTGFHGQPVAVLGLGRSGLSAARALVAGGAEVLAWDNNEPARNKALAEGIPLVDLMTTDWDRLDTLVISPGIAHTHPAPHPIAAEAKEAGARLICDVELLLRARPAARYVAITGTNGKSTTTTLIGHVLNEAGWAVAVGGNLGTPALDLAPLDSQGVYVLELSSYQLELVPSLACSVAVLLNISPDHLDRHGGLEGYVTAKRNIFANQPADGVAVVGVDDPHTAAIAAALSQAGRRVVPISGDKAVAGGVFPRQGQLVEASLSPDGTEGPEVLDLTRIPTLQGSHNRQNAAAAWAATRALGLEAEQVAAGLASFPGLAHRQELVDRVDGVLFVNDSKATNADATARAFATYDTIFPILGGRAKEGGIQSLTAYFPRIRHAFLIGEAATAFAETLTAAEIPFTQCGTLDKAVPAAFSHAKAWLSETGRDPDAQAASSSGPVVLLSPACASWDQFSSFEARGDAFRGLVQRCRRPKLKPTYSE